MIHILRPARLGALLLPLALACGGGGSKSPTSPITGTGGGTITVLPPQFPGENFWVAYQDGNGPWKVVGPAGGKYTFTVTDPAGRYGLAFVDEVPGSPTPQWVGGSLYYFTRAEVSQVDLSGLTVLTSATMSASVTGLNVGDTARLKVRSRTSSVPAGGSALTLNGFSGLHDLLATRQAGGAAADRLVVLRNTALAQGAVLPNIDFATQGHALVPQMATSSGADAGDSLVTYANWMTPGTSTTLAQVSGSILSFNALPSANHLADETHFIGAQATQPGTGKSSLAGQYTKTPVGVAISLPAKVSTPQFGTSILSPYYRPSITWAPLSGSQVSTVFAFDTTNYIFWDTNFSAGWLAGNAASTFTFPDFSALAGWNNAWGLIPGSTLSWTFANRWSSAPDAAFLANLGRTHPEGERTWRSTMVFSATATVAPKGTPEVSARSVREGAGRIPHRDLGTEIH